jgi:hypothetical protein
MILIYPEKLSSVTADTEDGSFPATYLENNKPKRYYKSGGSNACVLTATIAANSDQISLFNTNAESAELDVKVGGISQETFSIDLTSPHSHDRFWQSYTLQAVIHTIEITLTAPVGEVVYGGVLKAGTGVVFINPKYGLGESRRDFSMIKELNNGAYYIRKKDSVRTFSVSFEEDRATDFYNFSQVADYYGPTPFAILVVENIDDLEWAIFGHILNPFSGNHAYYSHTDVSFTVTEAV